MVHYFQKTFKNRDTIYTDIAEQDINQSDSVAKYQFHPVEHYMTMSRFISVLNPHAIQHL